MSLSHAIRERIRGILREISFVEPDPGLSGLAPSISADALAALVGPCKNLRTFSFPSDWGVTAARACVVEEAAPANWVDEAFGGHTQLAALTQLPPLSDSVLEHILSHLPGLVELTSSPGSLMSARLLAALARSCPDLRVLRGLVSSNNVLRDFAAPSTLWSTLKRLDLWNLTSEPLQAVIVPRLSAVTSLKLHSCSPDVLVPLASHLTSLKLAVYSSEKDLPGPWLCKLEALSLTLSHSPHLVALTPLLAANQATLRRLTLTMNRGCLTSTDVPSLVASLCALPHLTRLRLSAPDTGCPLSTLLPPELVDRLERLRIDLAYSGPDPVRIASNHLQQLRLHIQDISELAVACPALVELDTTGNLTSLQCPRLRALKATVHNLAGAAAPMPDLEDAAISPSEEDIAWLLTESPRLRVLSCARLARPDLLARLCACGSLVRLDRLDLDVIRFPNPLVLRLPPQLERLDLHIERGTRPAAEEGPLDLQVEAPGLLEFSLVVTGSPARMRLHNCPALVRFGLRAFSGLSLVDAEEETPARMRPRKLAVDGLDAASLLDFLARHGARLRDILLVRLQAATKDYWPKLMVALSGLPHLARLNLDASRVSSDLTLACPQLRELVLDRLRGDGSKVVLACPMLKVLSDLGHPRRQLVLTLPAPGLSVRT
ncbi:hypothetical protein PAPYR_12491 [Paratrimastix pyriformis]|uniref:Uncharacterized protein n=1 Tax=Paratrimastix pyriformis TaxID=342808 RepID=A0ABQ8U8I3_9EUKA|nr:hypothetical protein PAPYR_12491 [Paratrimastix pyriformis]